MKRKIITLFIMFLCVATILGCIGGPESTPEESLGDYISYYNAGEFNKIYDELLSSEVKEEYSKDEFYNMNSISEATFHIEDYEITDRTEENNSVLLTVDVSWNVEALDIQRTKTHNIEFVVEDNRWKMDDILRPIEI